MQLLAAAGGAVLCLGPGALAVGKKATAVYGQCVELTPTARALSPAGDWMDTLRYSVRLGMGNDDYIPMPETEEWHTKSMLDFDRIILMQRGRLMTKEEKHDWWLEHTPDGIEYRCRQLVGA